MTIVQCSLQMVTKNLQWILLGHFLHIFCL